MNPQDGMGYLWGKTEVPELTYVPIMMTKPWIPDQKPGAFHQPTGLRLMSVPTLTERRGYEQDFFLYGPEDEGWTLRISTDAEAFLRNRLLAHIGMESLAFSALPSDRSGAVEIAFLKEHGDAFECVSALPERASPPARWTVERRDALVMMLFFSLERRHEDGPFPSMLTLRALGVPEELQGEFRNPIWERFLRDTRRTR